MLNEEIRKQVLQILVDYHNEDIGNDAADKIIALMKSEQEKELDELGNKIAYLVEQKDMKSSQEKELHECWQQACNEGSQKGYTKGCHEERQALLAKISKIEKYHQTKCKGGLLCTCFQKLVNEIKQSIGTEKDYTKAKVKYGRCERHIGNGIQCKNKAEIQLCVKHLELAEQEAVEQERQVLSEKIESNHINKEKLVVGLDKVVNEWVNTLEGFSGDIDEKDFLRLKQKFREAVGK